MKRKKREVKNKNYVLPLLYFFVNFDANLWVFSIYCYDVLTSLSASF